MATRSFIRGAAVVGAIAGIFLYLPAPGGGGANFVGRAQAQTAGADPSITKSSVQGVSQQEASVAKAACWDERDSVDAEKNYPGPLLDMAMDDLKKCEAKAQAAK